MKTKKRAIIRTTLISLGCLFIACDQQTPHAPTCDGDTCEQDADESICDADTCDSDTPEPQFCQGETSLLYDPAGGEDYIFPDDVFTVDDPDQLTGIRLSLEPNTDIELPRSLLPVASIFQNLSELDGFGVNSDILIKVSAPIDSSTLPPSGEGSGQASSSVVIVDLSTDTPEFIDFEHQSFDQRESSTLVISPIPTLSPMGRYGIAVTTRVHDAQGDCIAPSPAMIELLQGQPTDPKLQRVEEPVQELIQVLIDAGTIEHATELTAGVVFSTQSTVGASLAIAEQIPDLDLEYRVRDTCETRTLYRICHGELDAWDFRVDGLLIDDHNPSPQMEYTIPVIVYLPLDPNPTPTSPYPTLIYGHGLSGGRTQAQSLAQVIAPLGFAVVAIDAVKHNEHPDTPKAEPPMNVLEFFGIDLTSGTLFEPRYFRDNLRQSTYDKLQLLQVLRGGIDADGDDTPDLGTDFFGYFGLSMGGIMAPEFAAFAPEAQVVVAVVPGARMGRLVANSDAFAMALDLFFANAHEADLALLYAGFQTAVDRGDPGSYLAAVIQERFVGFDESTPQFLMQMAEYDEVISTPGNLAYAYELGVPHVGEAIVEIPTVAHEPTLPVTGNLSAQLTGGIFQFDVVTATGIAADHNNVFLSEVGSSQWSHFITSTLDNGVAEIIDPYELFGF